MEGFAAYCKKGHHIGSVEQPYRLRQMGWYLEAEARRQRRFSEYCGECGSEVFERCPSCEHRIAPYSKYCVGCGAMLPWTEFGLAAARAMTDDLDGVTEAEKSALNESFREITTDSAMTPVAASRLRRFMGKASPVVQSIFIEVSKALATSEAKRYLGLP